MRTKNSRLVLQLKIKIGKTYSQLCNPRRQQKMMKFDQSLSLSLTVLVSSMLPLGASISLAYPSSVQTSIYNHNINYKNEGFQQPQTYNSIHSSGDEDGDYRSHERGMDYNDNYNNYNYNNNNNHLIGTYGSSSKSFQTQNQNFDKDSQYSNNQYNYPKTQEQKEENRNAREEDDNENLKDNEESTSTRSGSSIIEGDIMVVIVVVLMTMIVLVAIGCGVYMICKKDNPDSGLGYSVAISNRLFKVQE